jgi:hypothetical protein
MGKGEEQRLRDWVVTLRGLRSAVRGTLLELEAVSVESPYGASGEAQGAESRSHASRQDLEYAVVMQELLSVKVTRGDNSLFFG